MYIGRTKIFKDFQYCYPFSSKTATLLNGKDVMGLFLKENFYGLQFSEINNIANCYPLSMFRDFIQIA